MKTLSLFATAGLLVCGVCVSAQTPTLKDTLQWMHNTLESGGGSLFMSTGKDGSVEKRELTMPEENSCSVTFGYQIGPLEKNSSGVIRKPTFQLVEKFNLKDIDPTTVESAEPVHTSAGDGPSDMIGPYVLFSATTRDNAKLISAFTTLYPGGTEETSTSDRLNLELPYPYASRFTKAFKHAVMLCGGKPSSY